MLSPEISAQDSQKLKMVNDILAMGIKTKFTLSFDALPYGQGLGWVCATVSLKGVAFSVVLTSSTQRYAVTAQDTTVVENRDTAAVLECMLNG